MRVEEYVILCLTPVDKGGKTIAGIIITSEGFELKDTSGNVFYQARRMGDSDAIISAVIPDLSLGVVFRFRQSDQKLYVISDVTGERELECEVTISIIDEN